MAKYNGSGVLLYSNGVEFAAQKGLNLSANQALFDTTNKQSGGWAEHGNGLRSLDLSLESLQSTTGLSASGLFDYIKDRKSIMAVISGLATIKVMEVDCSNMTINAPTEEAVGLSGSFKAKGRIFNLSTGTPNLITDPDAGGTDYDTMTVTGIKIASAINAANTAYVLSNTISVVDTGIYKLFLFLTKTSGELPSVALYDNTSADISNVVVLTEGLNVITLISTATDISASLKFRNTTDANWSTSNIYLMKV